MSDRPSTFVPLVLGDYHKHTMRLTTEHHGCYFLLIMDYWINGAPPDDDAVLASITKLSVARWKSARPLVEPFFKIKKGKWVQERIEKEFKAAKARKARSLAGQEASIVARFGSSHPSVNKRKSLGPLAPSSSTASASTELEPPLGSNSCGKGERFIDEKLRKEADEREARRLRMEHFDSLTPDERRAIIDQQALEMEMKNDARLAHNGSAEPVRRDIQ